MIILPSLNRATRQVGTTQSGQKGFQATSFFGAQWVTIVGMLYSPSLTITTPNLCWEKMAPRWTLCP